MRWMIYAKRLSRSNFDNFADGAKPIQSKLTHALFRRPQMQHLRMLAVEIAWLAPMLALAIAFSPMLHWAPSLGVDTLRLALVAIVLPSLGEELLFRVALLPTPEPERRFPWRAAALALFAFVLWHPLQALLFGGVRRAIFLDPWFLAAVAALGIGCTRLYWRSGSVWPPVLLHWLVVVGWKALAGGPPLV